MTVEEINIILTKYQPLIIANIKKVNIPPDFLNSKCINLDDIIQEVNIKLWHLLENEYDVNKSSLENFLGYQAAWNAKKILSNLRRSSRCFTGSLDMNKKGGSKQASIDQKKIYMSTLDKSIHAYGNSECLFLNGWRGLQDKNLVDKSWETLGNESDYYYLIDEVIKKLDKLYNKDVYKEIFMFILLNQDDLSDDNFYAILSEKFKYRSKLGIKNVINKIYNVVHKVIEEYNT